MFTALQFSQLVAAAWSGPAAAHHATVSHYVAPSGYQATQYQVSYHPYSPSGQLESCYYAHRECPFQAVAAAVAAAAAAGVPVSRHRAQRAIARTAAALCGVPHLRPGFAGRCLRHRCARLSYVQR